MEEPNRSLFGGFLKEMKQAPQNEIDLLLRKLGRVEWPDSIAADAEHLDADELNAYAENALPEVARAKYTEHLAECSKCRRLISQLAPATVYKMSKVEVAPSAVSKFLSQLISPRFLRYAVPSLAAIVILSVGLVFMRRQSREVGQLVAMNEQPNTVATDKAAQTAAESTPSAGFVNDAAEETKPKQVTPSARQADKTGETKQAMDDLQPKADLEKRPEVGRADRAEPVAAAPAATTEAPKPAAAGREVASSNEVVDKKKLSEDEITRAKEKARKVDNYQVAQGVATTQTGARRGGPAKSEPASELARDKQEKDTQEVRTVAGHRFRRENGIWIDTAYDSRATTNLSRGSEQYRALVADEPDIRMIADQLNGEIIIVWKGRAYRIR